MSDDLSLFLAQNTDKFTSWQVETLLNPVLTGDEIIISDSKIKLFTKHNNFDR